MPEPQQAPIEDKSVQDKNGPTGKEVSSELKKMRKTSRSMQTQERLKINYEKRDLLEKRNVVASPKRCSSRPKDPYKRTKINHENLSLLVRSF
jgi:hypothetical protein